MGRGRNAPVQRVVILGSGAAVLRTPREVASFLASA
jgi:hypothetical protein